MSEVRLVVDGELRQLEDRGQSLLTALRADLGLTSPKDGCSPQGQCGCCTVLVDGAARVSCVTALRRVAGRRVTTAAGLDPEVGGAIAAALVDHGGTQCGFCSPGIVCRLASLGPAPTRRQVHDALLAHLCRCTGWQGIVDAALSWRPGTVGSVPVGAPDEERPDETAAARRAALEGGSPQRRSPAVALGQAVFADDRAPDGALVAIPDGAGGWVVAESLEEARSRVGHRQGRRSGAPLAWPLEVPPGRWDAALVTGWVEPAALEPDASWCLPGGDPAPVSANGGAFGAKHASPLPALARELADRYGRAVRVLRTREDVVRDGPKRPPVAGGANADGSGVLRVARTPGIAEAVAAVAPRLRVVELDVVGPPTSAALRAAGWAEAAVLLAGAAAAGSGAPGVGRPAEATVRSPSGATAHATVSLAGPAPAAGSGAAGLPTHVVVELSCGDLLDAAVTRSYAVGAAHMALGWVCSEGVAVGPDGVPEDLTIRSFGVLRARDTPPIEVHLLDGPGEAVNGSDAVFAAVAAATWIAQGLPARWPTLRSAPG